MVHVAAPGLMAGEPATPGRFGAYGGRYAPESLIEACREVADAFREAWAVPGT